MGKITSLVEFQGKVGNLVGSKGKDGRSVIRQYQYNPRDAKSRLQMERRVAWANMVAFWRAMKSEDRPSFQNKPAAWSDFNAFISANEGRNKVFLTKKEARIGVCIAAPYQVSEGELSTIGMTSLSGGKFKTDLALGDLVIDGDTTVSTFTKAILDNNEGWENGDRLTCIYMPQVVVGYDQIPMVNTVVSAVTLNKGDNTSLWDVVNDFCFGSTDGYISSKNTVNGGIVWIHSRRDEGTGKILVSTQTMDVNSTLLDTYMSDGAMNDAIKSYGGTKYRGILDPTNVSPVQITQVNP